jgi:hypothetical protein
MGTTMDQVVEQPTPKFTLNELENKLATIYSLAQKIQRQPELFTPEDKANFVGGIQELLGKVTKCITDLTPIDVAGKQYEELVLSKLEAQKVQFTVCGVQLWENKQLRGTSLYSTVVKARTIRDTCNAEYARLKVDHEAKIVNYPVF